MDGVERTVESLVGEELSTVSFVRDYVEFHFDGPVLRAIANPRVEDGSRVAVFPGAGSRDALCALIGRIVRAVDACDGVHIRLVFRDGPTLTVPLDVASLRAGEGAHFQSTRTSPVQVWDSSPVV
jgi:hypothetical protein